ncbi:MAG: thiamine-phosphate synthase family protein [Fervidicoccaceae archaeon]
MARLAVLSCTSDPARCAEADVKAAVAYDLIPLILNRAKLREQLSSLAEHDVLKVSFTDETGLSLEEAELISASRALLVLGPGVSVDLWGALLPRASLAVSIEGSKLLLTWKEKERAVSVESLVSRRGPDAQAYANTVASLASCFLARGEEPGSAAKRALAAAWEAWRYCEPSEHGCVPAPEAPRMLGYHRWEVLENLQRALGTLAASSSLIISLGLVPEVGINVAMSLPSKYARGPEDVAAFPGRIVAAEGLLRALGPPTFGASRHLARAILAVQKSHPVVRAAVNVRYSEKLVEAAQWLGLNVSSYDRREEPEEVKAREGATIPWGVGVALEKLRGARPDVIYHVGDYGKEPMLTVFGERATDVVDKLVRMARAAAGAVPSLI